MEEGILPRLAWPTLYVQDITAPGTASQDLIVQYPWSLGVDPSSIGDGDVVVARRRATSNAAS